MTGPVLGALAANRTLRILAWLKLSGRRHEVASELPPDSLRRFAHAEQFAALRELRFQHVRFGDQGVEALLASPLMNRLTALNLADCSLTDRGARLLAADPRVQRLSRPPH